jgi:hypothetical protein
MKHEDDFISKLMDETYDQVEHPSNELSNHNVVSLFDYFKERENAVESPNANHGVSVFHYSEFLRIKVDDHTLDIPQNLDWVSTTKQDQDNTIYEIVDETFSNVVSELCGTKVKFIVVGNSQVELCSEMPRIAKQGLRAA